MLENDFWLNDIYVLLGDWKLFGDYFRIISF